MEEESKQNAPVVPTPPTPPTQPAPAVSSASNPFLVPLSILIAGGLIAAAMFYGGGNGATPVVVDGGAIQPAAPTGTTDAVREVTAEDHIKGDLNAGVKIVEFSDYECPFCKRFHDTMNAVMDEVGESGDVAWVFRHFPLEQLHPRNATAVAMASECAAEQGGNDMFWEFSDRFMELTPSNDRTDLATVLPQIYGEIGLNQSEMDACIKEGRYISDIEEDANDAIATGGRGTPWSVVIAPNGKTFPLNGAQTYESVLQLIKLAAEEK